MQVPCARVAAIRCAAMLSPPPMGYRCGWHAGWASHQGQFAAHVGFQRVRRDPGQTQRRTGQSGHGGDEQGVGRRKP